eukprot:3130966-Pyramimonas_sp.AAC.1
MVLLWLGAAVAVSFREVGDHLPSIVRGSNRTHLSTATAVSSSVESALFNTLGSSYPFGGEVGGPLPDPRLAIYRGVLRQ